MANYNINENHPNITGRFGSGQARNISPTNSNTQNHRGNSTNFHLSKLGELTAERWVDIICISIISVFLISVLINWNAFLDSFFVNILFPIISVGAKLLGLVIGIGAVIGAIYARLRRPRRWY